MKHLFIALFLLFAAVTANAQLKVTNTGNVYIQRDSVTGQSSLSVGSMPGMTGCYYDTLRIGIRAYGYNTASTGNAIGVFSEAGQAYNNTYRFSAGVWGTSRGAYQSSVEGMNYGVVGTLHNGSLGAGIYGTNCDNAFFGLSDSFAGYFYGPVHVVGGVFATAGFAQPSDIRLKRDVVPVRDTESANGSTLDNLLSLEVLNYRLELPEKARVLTDSTQTGEDPNAKYASMRHYGVSAQELQKLFPDLVHEGSDGYLSVNYVEIVPLLIRSLQELKQQVDELKGGNARQTRAEQSMSDTFQFSGTTGNILYQNTPNPFREQTTIRFHLADDARDASICIFDMTGKMLRKLPVTTGMESVTVNGWELGEGLFLYSLIVNGQEIDTKRMMLSK